MHIMWYSCDAVVLGGLVAACSMCCTVLRLHTAHDHMASRTKQDVAENVFLRFVSRRSCATCPQEKRRIGLKWTMPSIGALRTPHSQGCLSISARKTKAKQSKAMDA